jgi:hypothetical protein
MYVARVWSINNGLSFLVDNKPNEWEEITKVLNLLELEVIVSALDAAKREVGNIDNVAADYMNAFIRVVLNALNSEWPNPEEITNAHNDTLSPIKSSGSKNGVTVIPVGTNISNDGNFVHNILLKIPYYFTSGIAEVSVLLIPMQETLDLFNTNGITYSQIQNLPTEKVCREQLVKFGPISSKAPAAILFYSPTEPDNIVAEDIISLTIESVPSIERNIEFAPEYYQAGVGLLSYFGEVLRQKDPNTKAKVRIEQDGNTVRLHIVPPVGEAEIVEKQLEQFALVISEQAAPETLLSNQAHIIQLKSQLEMARLQVQTAQEIKQITDGVNAQRFAGLEKQVESLNMQLAAQLLQNNKVIDLVTQQASSHERMQAALLTHSGVLFKDLLEESRNNFQLLTAIQNLHQNLLSGLTTLDVEEQIKQALETVKQQKPGMLARIHTQVESAAMKAGAGATLGWAAEVVKHAVQTYQP